ncbi:glutathione synthetase ATP-binding domain-like protein [Polychaeton citri CBS 116435]|uniref:Glutathione synthetase ATP-binding domain-like protein n=1 Tax=Polychaeton citri CBS 116435 TaxID=1314669 RepID=A0A9P4UNZ6_9PEZI|nr:glutathione synthetase ATP-binding domain-like protein [Polychaeton citri CBS 116435]
MAIGLARILSPRGSRIAMVQKAAKVNVSESSSLWDILATAVGAVELANPYSTTDLDYVLTAIEAEIVNRLSLPLLLPNTIPRYKLALVHGRYDWAITDAVYRAAQEMDLEICVIAEGHWMQAGPHTSFRKDFIPVDIHRKDGTLSQRIVDALQNYPVQMDCIVTMTDGWLIPVAYAAEVLGLSTSSPSVFETCRDKYLTRLLDAPEGFQFLRVKGYEGAKQFLAKSRDVKFPLIVKPYAGYALEGVRKVYNREEFLDAAAKANLTDYGLGDLIAIESYIDGPEVDANFVMWEGEPISLEISDQFPAEADLDTQTSKSNFLETELFLPSALPSDEQATIKASMLLVLSKLGVRSGVFHMEARLRNSSMEYRITNGTQDLYRTEGKFPSGTQCILIENNCRPAGTNSNTGVLHTYGIEFHAIHMLIALGDSPRIQALSTPYLAGPQYHLDLISIPVSKGGIMGSRDATGDLFERFPDLKRTVVKCGTYFQHG